MEFSVLSCHTVNGRAQTETQVFLILKSLFFPLGYTIMGLVSDHNGNHSQFRQCGKYTQGCK